MSGPLIAIVGDANPDRKFSPEMKDPARARKAAEELGAELAQRGARLLVYGGPFLEADVVRGFVAAKPTRDRSILMWYTKDQEPPPFPEEQTHPALFDRRPQRGADWEIAFYRSITRADGLLLIGGDNATKISGQVAIGTRMPLLALAAFGGAAARVWDTLTAGGGLRCRPDCGRGLRQAARAERHPHLGNRYGPAADLSDCGAPPGRWASTSGTRGLKGNDSGRP
jgi:hypothetical protein